MGNLSRLIFTFCLFILVLAPTVSAKSFNPKARVLHTEHTLNNNKSWTKISENTTDSILELIKILKRSKTGKKLLMKAKKKAASHGETLTDIILPGDGSITDTTLTRKFSPSDPHKVVYHSHSKIFLNKDHSIKDALLDMAHELTHYTFRTAFNPYLKNFSLGGFIASTVEGRGGEVEAYLVECKVLFELFPKDWKDTSDCSEVIDKNTGKLSKALGTQKFYQVGRHFNEFAQKMKNFKIDLGSFPYLAKSDPIFISSAYDLPYPVAAFQEYVTIMEKACANDLKRLVIMKKKLARAPASDNPRNNALYSHFKSTFDSRCEDYLN